MTQNNILLTGTDGGNISNKVSFINQEGNIESFLIETVIAEAPDSKSTLKSEFEKKQNKPEDYLHVRISSTALPQNENNKAWYVGNIAKKQDQRFEPVVGGDGKTDKKYDNKIHTITTLTGLAVSAVKTNNLQPIAPYSGGLPITEYKEHGEDKVLKNLINNEGEKHRVEFIDGPMAGKVVEIEIRDGIVGVEGITSVMALSFDIVNNEIIETPLSAHLQESFILHDLGAGTSDTAIFTEEGLDKDKSNSTAVGTNSFIDKILTEIENLPVFNDLKELLSIEMVDGRAKTTEAPYRTRSTFMKQVIEPETQKVIKAEENNEVYEPKFLVSWAMKKDVDVTEIVLKHMNEYVLLQKRHFMKTIAEANVSTTVVVGGGLLFGYLGFKKLKAEPLLKENLLFPSKLSEAQFFTSRAYLIENYLEQIEKQNALTLA